MLQDMTPLTCQRRKPSLYSNCHERPGMSCPTAGDVETVHSVNFADTPAAAGQQRLGKETAVRQQQHSK